MKAVDHSKFSYQSHTQQRAPGQAIREEEKMLLLLELLPYAVVTAVYLWATVSAWRLLRCGKDHTLTKGVVIRYLLLSVAYAWIVNVQFLHTAAMS
jgi:hypothetical protein